MVFTIKYNTRMRMHVWNVWFILCFFAFLIFFSIRKLFLFIYPGKMTAGMAARPLPKKESIFGLAPFPLFFLFLLFIFLLLLLLFSLLTFSCTFLYDIACFLLFAFWLFFLLFPISLASFCFLGHVSNYRPDQCRCVCTPIPRCPAHISLTLA